MKNSYRIIKSMLYFLSSKHPYVCIQEFPAIVPKVKGGNLIVSGPSSETESKIVKILYLEGLLPS